MTHEKTATEITLALAIKRIKNGTGKVVSPTQKLNIAAVAKEAGVSNSTIHNRYPNIAKEIRELMALEASHLKSKTEVELQKKLTELRKDNKELKSDLEKSQSINFRLLKENELLKAQVIDTKTI